MGLPRIEYIGGVLPKNLLEGVSPPFSTDLSRGKQSIWIYGYTSRKETAGASPRSGHNSELTAWLSARAVWGYTHRAQSNLKNNNKKNPSKVIVTQGQISLSRVLRIGYHARETTEIWRFDSWLQNAFLLCLRIAGNNISPFIIGRDQRPGRGHVHTLTLVPWKHKAPDESLHKKRNGEGRLDTLTEVDSKLRLTASLSWQVQLLPSSTVIT